MEMAAGMSLQAQMKRAEDEMATVTMKIQVSGAAFHQSSMNWRNTVFENQKAV